MKKMIVFLVASSILGCAGACSGGDETNTYDEDDHVIEEGDYEVDDSGTDPSDAYSSDMTFRGYDCTEDCSGHEAGYAWAEENGITAPDDCGGNSNSFYEGCVAYAEEWDDGY